MRFTLSLLTLAALAAALVPGCSGTPVARAEAGPVEVVRVPDGGIQPQAAADARGVTHLVYLKGDPAACDVFYTRREKGNWSAPVRVNSRPRGAVAMGTIRGPHLALGKSGRVHVVWFGSGQSGLKGPGDSAPLLYTRSNDAGSAFEPERNLMQFTTALDGGGSIAADAAGNVYVAWHAGDGVSKGEGERRLWVARSTDEGKTFSREASAWREPTGACPCCSTKAFADSRGDLYVLYRAATGGTRRDMVLLASKDRGGSFRGARIDPWPVDT